MPSISIASCARLRLILPSLADGQTKWPRSNRDRSRHAIGQFETEIRAERQMDGIKKAKDRGVQFGKRPALTNEQIAELREKRAQGTLIKDLMAEYSLSKATIYRYLTENAA